MWRSGGEKGLRLSCAGKLGVPLERDWYVEELFELHQGCQVRFRISRGNVVFHLRRCSGKGPHLAMTGEPRGFSWVSVRFSSSDGEIREPLVLAREVQSPFELRKGAGGCSRVTAGQIDLI